MSKPRIAFIGAGAIGLPMAARASRAGDVTVVDVSEERLDAARAQGWATTTSLGAALPADIVLVMVATEPQARAVLEGPDGLYARTGPETTVAILSTLGPDALHALGRSRPQEGPHLLDIPVTGGIPGAVAGTLTLFASGDRTAIERHRTVLGSMGSVVDAGPAIGNGQSFKMVNQLLATSQLVVAAEALSLAGRLGLATSQVLDAVRGGAGGSWMLENFGPRMLDSDVLDIAARLDIFLKDAELVRRTTRAANFDSPMIEAACHLLGQAADIGLGAQDASVVMRAYAGAPVPRRAVAESVHS